MCSPVASSVPSYVATSLRSSSIVPLSLSPFMNCSVSNLSHYMYWHSAALVLSLPIYSWADSLCFLCNLQYCNDITILLCCGLKLLYINAKRPLAVLHFSFPSWLKVCSSCRSSWSTNLLPFGPFPPQKVHTLWYLPCVPQLNAAFTSTCPLCFCLCG